MTTDTLVSISDGKATTTSLKVAEFFDKLHKDVLKAIKELNCSSKFNGRNFAPVKYLDAKGEERPMYNITKDGFIFLAMGFTGDKAAQFKEMYIDAFNRMELRLTKAATKELTAGNEAETFQKLATLQETIMLSGGISAKAKQELYRLIHDMQSFASEEMTPKRHIPISKVYQRLKTADNYEGSIIPEPTFSLDFKMRYRNTPVLPATALAKILGISTTRLNDSLLHNSKCFVGRRAVFRNVLIDAELRSQAAAYNYEMPSHRTVHLYTTTGARIMAVLHHKIKGVNRSKAFDLEYFKQNITKGEL